MSSSFKVKNFDITPLETLNISYFDNQISGHSCLLKGKDFPQLIYKPYHINEEYFYEAISKTKQHPLLHFIPTYYGTYQISKSQLENLAEQIPRPESPEPETEESSHEVETNYNSQEELQSPNSESSLGNSYSKTEWIKSLCQHRFNENNTSNTSIYFGSFT